MDDFRVWVAATEVSKRSPERLLGDENVLVFPLSRTEPHDDVAVTAQRAIADRGSRFCRCRLADTVPLDELQWLAADPAFRPVIDWCEPRWLSAAALTKSNFLRTHASLAAVAGALDSTAGIFSMHTYGKRSGKGLMCL